MSQRNLTILKRKEFPQNAWDFANDAQQVNNILPMRPTTAGSRNHWDYWRPNMSGTQRWHQPHYLSSRTPRRSDGVQTIFRINLQPIEELMSKECLVKARHSRYFHGTTLPIENIGMQTTHWLPNPADNALEALVRNSGLPGVATAEISAGWSAALWDLYRVFCFLVHSKQF